MSVKYQTNIFYTLIFLTYVKKTESTAWLIIIPILFPSNSDFERGLPDFSTLKHFDIEPRKKVSDKNYTEYKCQPITFRANRRLAITASANVVGFVSWLKEKKKLALQRQGSSHWGCFIKRSVFIYFRKLTGKHLRPSLLVSFLTKLQPWDL